MQTVVHIYCSFLLGDAEMRETTATPEHDSHGILHVSNDYTLFVMRNYIGD